MEEKDFYWLVGILEGEGTFLKALPSKKNKISIQLQMTDEDIVNRVAKLLGVAYYKCMPKKKHHKVSFRCAITGFKAAELMEKIKPFMGSRRQLQIEKVIASYTFPKKYKELPAIEVLTYMHKTLSLRQISKVFDCSYQRIYRALKQTV